MAGSADPAKCSMESDGAAAAIRAKAIRAARERTLKGPSAPADDGSMAHAKRCLQPRTVTSGQWRAKARATVDIEAIATSAGSWAVRLTAGGSTVVLEDNTERIALAANEFGDDLPSTPAVLLGVATNWAAGLDGGAGWSARGLASRGCSPAEPRFGVDGGPSWAREDLSAPAVTLEAYAEYCAVDAEGDDAPLYIFDEHMRSRTFADGTAMQAECTPTPQCFRHDAMAGVGWLRPLPPSWLLVGAKRSGTPIHNHPFTVAWNVLLTGCKLWAAMPPAADELAADQGSALGWFLRNGRLLPRGGAVIVQRPGETVFIPMGWWHVVLNCEESTAVSSSLALRRDFVESHGELLADDPEFAAKWLESVQGLGWPAPFLPPRPAEEVAA